MIKYKYVNYYGDSGGCGCYRMLWPAWLTQTIKKDIEVVNVFSPIPMEQYYQNVRAIRIQRQVTSDHLKYIKDFIYPICKKYNIWLIYEIDDAITSKDIPKYNKNWRSYQNPDFQQNITAIMNMCDFVTVTTEHLKQNFVENYKIDANKFVVIPNMLPKWWIDGLYHESTIESRIDNIIAGKRKPTILFASSLSHFDVLNQNNQQDDFTHIIDFIETNRKTYQFYFCGTIPQQLKQYKDDFKINDGFNIMVYPKEIAKLNPDLVISPLQDNEFNKCKSNIKVLEYGAMGIPNVCQNISTYNQYTNLLFDDSKDLSNTVVELFSDKNKYMNYTIQNRKFVETGYDGKSWFMEDNIDTWLQLYSFPQKTMEVNMDVMKFDNIKEKKIVSTYKIEDKDFCPRSEQ